MEYGIVKFFDERIGKKYGFLYVLDDAGQKTGEEIFFHYNDSALVDHDQLGPFFDDREDVVGTPDIPAKGQKLVFERKDGKGGKHKACPWAFANEWDDHEVIAAAYSDTFEEDSETCGYCGGSNPGINCACEEGDPLHGEMSGVLGPGLRPSGNV